MPEHQTPQTTTPTPATGPTSGGPEQSAQESGQQQFGSNSAAQSQLPGSGGPGGPGAAAGVGGGQTELTPEQKANAVVDKMGTNIGTNPLRQEYMETIRAMSAEIEPMKAQGKSDEEIARYLHQKRIDIGKQYKALTPWPLREYILEVNMGRYQNEYGPSVEYLLKKYNGDWSQIIRGSCSPNDNIDGLLKNFRPWIVAKAPDYIDRAYNEFCK